MGFVSYLKQIFAEPSDVGAIETRETWGGTRFKDEFKSEDGTATIRQMKNGKFRLLVNGNEVVQTYARKRDAIRGATRRGLIVESA